MTKAKLFNYLIQAKETSENIHTLSLIHKLLKNFKVPMLMNTSFNLAGYPMVETFKDILNTVKNSSLKYVYFSDYNKILIDEKE